jgi:hypothetical protein
MTEAEWWESTDLLSLLSYVQFDASGRKARLFACGCCRRIWDGLKDVRSRRAVEHSERLADGLAGEDEFASVYREAFAAIEAADRRAPTTGAARGAAGAARAALQALHGRRATPFQAAYYAAVAYTGDVCAVTPESVRYDADVSGRAAERQFHLDLARDLTGNPFRPPPAVELAWREGRVRRLARRIYDGHRFEELPILADALEEAGCTSAELLAHLRAPGPHARGCWAVDLLLERPGAVIQDREDGTPWPPRP